MPELRTHEPSESLAGSFDVCAVFLSGSKMDLLGESTAKKSATDGDFREITRNTKACGSMT